MPCQFLLVSIGYYIKLNSYIICLNLINYEWNYFYTVHILNKLPIKNFINMIWSIL